ncbi:RNA polymerase sigma factor [Emticicia sp. SJ17W-69]|uniref:RNA polymerase sigma factor n=1 Tax=Emticicia sp. SJ17W-69 TaxID=3421657 RepID=UPI003EC0D945
MQKNELIPYLFKTEYRKIISVLCKLFGIVHIEIAEDIANDTFLLATETWSLKGIPDNPTAWLHTVAQNKTRDYFRRNKIFTEKIAQEIKHNQEDFEEIDIDLSRQNIADSQLQMMFTICNPVIPIEAQIGLALRILCGFGIEEIAEAFLSNKETINKRLFRAKEKLREENIKVELPDEVEIDKRLEAVLTTIYLLFNEGYYSSTQNQNLRKELCLEAMRLNYLLLENSKTNKPRVNALLSLMCFHASRFEARFTDSGEYILYENQNRDLWNDDLIEKGNYFLIESAKGQEISKYHLEASIAYWHCTKVETPNKWENILQLYNRLLQIEYSPIAALNRTYALAKTSGKQEAIKEALKLNLSDNHLYHSLLAELFTDLDNDIALNHLKTAMKLSKTEVDKAVISKKMQNLI